MIKSLSYGFILCFKLLPRNIHFIKTQANNFGLAWPGGWSARQQVRPAALFYTLYFVLSFSHTFIFPHHTAFYFCSPIIFNDRIPRTSSSLPLLLCISFNLIQVKRTQEKCFFLIISTSNRRKVLTII